MRIALFSGSTGSGGANRAALDLVTQRFEQHGADAIEAGDVADIPIFRPGAGGIGFDTDGIP